MKPRRGRRDRPFFFREEGLVSLPVPRVIFSFDVGRQRNVAVLIQVISDISNMVDPHQKVPLAQRFQNRNFPLGFQLQNLGALDPLGGTD